MMNERELEEKLLIILKEYYNDNRLIEKLSSAFTRKGLARDIPNKLFMELTTLGQLNTIQLAWLTIKLSEYTDEKGNRLFKDLEPTKYFTEIEIKNVNEYVNFDEKIDCLIFRDVYMNEDGTQFICPFCDVNTVTKYKKNELFSYEFETQREGNIRLIGTEGAISREIYTNPKSVDAIADLIYENKFTANLITLNIPMLGLKNEEDYKYDKEKRILKITPHYDATQNNLTYVNVIDGWHRLCGAEKAVERAKAENEGRKLTNGFIIAINLMTPMEAKKHFKRENTYNPIDKNYLESFELTDESRFIESIVGYTDIDNIFKNNVMRTYEETKSSKYLTYYKVLEDGLRYTNIDCKNMKSIKYRVPIIVRFINNFVNYMINFYGYNDWKELRNKTNLLDMNIFIGYIKIASLIQDEIDVDDYVEKLADIIVNDKIENELKTMGLNNKIYSAKTISKYFEQIFEKGEMNNVIG